MIRQKIYSTFYYLAGLDVLTILISVVIAYGYSQLSLEIKESGQTWIENETRFDNLSELIIDLSKPGNEVFEKRDHVEKKREFDETKSAIDMKLADLKETLKRFEVEDPNVSELFVEIEKHLLLFDAYAQNVFSDIKTGDIETAGTQMAKMDESFQNTLKNFLLLRKTLRNDYFLETQNNIENTRNLRSAEFFVWGFLIMLVASVIYYGKKVRAEVLQSEESLKDLHATHESLFDSVNEHSIVAKTDRKGVITYVNDRFCEISGYSREELIGQTHRLVRSTHHNKDFFADLWKQIGSGKVWRGEVCNRAKNGDHYWVDTTITPVKNEKGRIKEFLSIRTDITSRKEVEKFSDDIQAVALLGGFRLEKDSNGISLTNESYRLLEIDMTSKVTRKIVTSCFLDEHRKNLVSQIKKCFAYAKSFKGDFEIITKNGNRKWVRLICNPGMSIHDDISYIYGTVQDISVQKEQQKQIIMEKEQAEKAKAAKSNFLANMSHEMRTPLNGLIGMTELLLETSLNEKQKEMLETIDSCSENMLGLVNRVLNLSKIEAGKFELDLSEFDVRKMVNVAIKNSVPAFGGVEFKLDYRLSEDYFYYGDSLRIQQVLVNYIANAFKFTNEGEVKLTVNEKQGSDETSEIVFSVADTGTGIPPEKLSSVFEAFNQVDSSITKKYGGTGLGLSICREVAGLMGGEVWAESDLGLGTTFFFKLHMKRVFKKKIITQSTSGTFSGISTRKEKVLVVEDNLINQKIATHMLKDMGFPCEVAGNGQIAVEKIEESIKNDDPYTFVLMDLQMPVLDGLGATKEIFSRWPNKGIYIVALTANAFEEDKKRCFDAGMSDFMSKPFKKANLMEVLDRYFESRENKKAS